MIRIEDMGFMMREEGLYGDVRGAMEEHPN